MGPESFREKMAVVVLRQHVLAARSLNHKLLGMNLAVSGIR